MQNIVRAACLPADLRYKLIFCSAAIECNPMHGCWAKSQASLEDVAEHKLMRG